MDTDIYEIMLTDVALEELDEIYEYIHKNLSNKSAADRLMEKIENTFLALERNPYMCAEVHIRRNDEMYRKKQSFMSQKYELQDKITKMYPEQIAKLDEKIEAMEYDIVALQNQFKGNSDEFSPMTINN